MSIYLVKQNCIPDNFYMSKPEQGNWRYIQQFVFENGLEYYIGTNNLIDGFDEIIQTIKNEYDIFTQSHNVSELQQIFITEHKIYIDYNDSIKIWKYYQKNNKRIEDILHNFL